MAGGSSSFFVSGGGDPFKPRKTPKSASYAANVRRARAKKGHRSFLGNIVHDVTDVVGNAAHEAENMAIGSATGILDLAEHPSHAPDFGRAIVDDYKTRYGRIFHGDFSDLTKHPLSYILDAATIASLGAGGAARVGLLAREGGTAEIGLTRAAAKGGKGGVEVHLSANPLKRGREKAFIGLQKHVIPEKTPIIGIQSRANRTLSHAQRDLEARLRVSQRAFARVSKGLNHSEVTALDASLRGLSPKAELDFLRHLHKREGTHVPAETVARLSDKEANRLYEEASQAAKSGKEPSAGAKKILAAREKHVQLANESHQMLIDAGKIKPEAITPRAVLHHVLIRKALGQEVPEDAYHLAHEIESKTGFRPVYTPDNMLHAHRNKGGKQNEGVLFLKGVRAPAVAHMIDRHEQAARLAGAEAGKERLLKAAVKQDSDQLPKGWVWLNDSITDKDWLQKNIGRFEQEGQAFRSGSNSGQVFEQSLRSERMPEHRLAVPESTLQDVVNQRTRMVGTTSDMLSQATGLWKKIILGMRPAFVAGNYTGNQLLYHLHNGINPRYLAMARREAGTLEKHFGEHGKDFTLGATEMLKDKGVTNKAANLLFHAVSTHEHLLRVATMARQARKIPAFRAIEKETARAVKSGKLKLKDGETIFSHSLDQAIKEHPWIKDEIAQVIDDTMGNYRYYNRFETGLKQLVPFYGWNRHALRSYARLLEDHPALADSIAHLGAYGNEHNQVDFPDVPEFMQSYAKIPGLKKLGLGDTIDTRPLNPLSSGADTLRAISQAVQAKPGNLDAVTSNINPIVTAMIQAATNTNLQTGAPLPHSSLEALPAGGVLSQLVLGLPQVKLEEHLRGNDAPDPNDPNSMFTPTGRPKKPSEHMLGRGSGDMLAGLLGLPSREVNLPVAQKLKKRQDTQNAGFHVAKPRKRKRKKPTNPFQIP